nr:MAG TPA: hypothetical protein [Caudoviricetes sp.]
MEAKDIRKAHCLFEQSGTFKNEFIKLGIPVEDYDIQNHFSQTDHVIDLFGEIEKAYTKRTEQNRTIVLLCLTKCQATMLLLHSFRVFILR